MKPQIIEDGLGRLAGIFIPIPAWRQLKRLPPNDDGHLYPTPSNGEIINELLQVIEQLKLMEEGQIDVRDGDQLSEML